MNIVLKNNIIRSGTGLRQPICGQNRTTTNRPQNILLETMTFFYLSWKSMWQGSINYVHNTIKFTYEANPNQIQFLKTIVYKDTYHQQTHKLKEKTYIKTTIKQLYICPSRFLPPSRDPLKSTHR